MRESHAQRPGRRVRLRGGEGDPRGGFALLTVVLVLLALLVLCAPFLLTARNAEHASATLADRAEVRLALDTAGRHARAVLAASHPGLDPTPYSDSAEELEVDNLFAAEFLDANDVGGVMWDLEVTDLAGLIDLTSAPPQVFANLMGWSTRTTRPVAAEDAELPVASTRSFDPQGFLWVGGELVGYGEKQNSSFAGTKRGLGYEAPGEGQEPGPQCPPLAPQTHPAGQPVFDQRAFAIPLWRAASADGRLRRFDSGEQLAEAVEFAIAGDLGGESERASPVDEILARAGTPFPVRGAAVHWQHPTGLRRDLVAGQDCSLQVVDRAWINPGTTLRIRQGEQVEFAIVRAVRRGGFVDLFDTVQNDYLADRAEVAPLVRRPVNANTAPPDVLAALFENLQIEGLNERITATEADRLVGVVVESRPFTGFRDFLERVVLPAGGIEPLPDDAPVVPSAFAEQRSGATGLQGGEELAGFLDRDDALALYLNALNANDGRLAYGTMPLCFVSGDTYALELRAAVNAPSGVERVTAAREQVESVVPQRELLALWARQADFDEALRLSREAPFWATGPFSTGWFSARQQARPPSRASAHFGRQDDSEGKLERVFASLEEDGFAQLAAARTDEEGQRRGRVLHFDLEPGDLEGRYLPDGVVRLATIDSRLDWSDRNDLLRPLGLSLWIRPRALAEGDLFLDVGGPYRESDRVSLTVEGGDLVLRVLDGAGEHPGSPTHAWRSGFADRGEVRFELAGGQGPGFPLDTWSHVSIDVRGNRADQMTMLVDGRASARTPGLTRLTSNLAADGELIDVDSTEGFPAFCVLRIGAELIEAEVTGPQSFRAHFNENGPLAGFGGRQAREWLVRVAGQLPGFNVGLQKDVDHAAGTSVQLYGYSTPLASDVSTGGGVLDNDLGPFAVARLAGIEGAQTPEGDPIIVGGLLTGYGLEAASQTALVLVSADDPAGGDDFMTAFNRGPGYAAIVSVIERYNVFGFGLAEETSVGTELGGIEVVRYDGWSGSTLNVVARGSITGGELQHYAAASGDGTGGTRAFVVTENGSVVVGGAQRNDELRLRTFVVPISIPGGQGFPQPAQAQSGFAQLTRTDAAELTEWVRYDEVQVGFNQLVCSSPVTLDRVRSAVFGEYGFSQPPQNPGGSPDAEPDPGGGNPGQPSGGLGENLSLDGRSPSLGPAPLLFGSPLLFALPPAAASLAGPHWQDLLGVSEDENLSVTRAVRTGMQFRGVFGTYSHAQPAGTPVLPVFRLLQGTESSGWPGRLDHAFLMEDASVSPGDPGFPVVVHRAFRPQAYLVSHWDPVPGQPLSAAFAEETTQPFAAHLQRYIFVALEERAPVPLVATVNPTNADVRHRSRLVMYPSGELPRRAQQVALGGAFDGAGGLGVPSAVVDEVVFGATEFGAIAVGEEFYGSALVVTRELGIGAGDLEVRASVLRNALGDGNLSVPVLSDLPEDGGLLRVGEEILFYDLRDPSTGVLRIPGGGRGLLGTEEQPHPPGEGVSLLSYLSVSPLAGDIGPGDPFLPLVDLDEFPEQGTALVGDELVHFTRRASGALRMPSRSTLPGLADGEGEGVFRGRYGTEREGHSASDPVILFPFRYWDRHAERADGPEHSHFEFAMDQASAVWRGVFWEDEPAGHAGPRIGLLVRTDERSPWDADPERDPELHLFWDGTPRDDSNPLGFQSDRIEGRVFVRYEPGSYDARDGLAHGWKTTPRLRVFGFEYLAPGVMLRRVDR